MHDGLWTSDYCRGRQYDLRTLGNFEETEVGKLEDCNLQVIPSQGLYRLRIVPSSRRSLHVLLHPQLSLILSDFLYTTPYLRRSSRYEIVTLILTTLMIRNLTCFQNYHVERQHSTPPKLKITYMPLPYFRIRRCVRKPINIDLPTGLSTKENASRLDLN